MPIPEFVQKRVERVLADFCERRVPPRARHQVRLEFTVRGNSFTLVERRVPYDDPDGEWTRSPIARFDYVVSTGDWKLMWRDRNQRWHHYDRLDPTTKFDDALSEVDQDPTAIFWG